MPFKTHEWWRDKVLSIKANNPKWGEGRIQTRLEQIWTAGEDDSNVLVPTEAGSPPVGRTIGRILRQHWDPMTDEERAQYRDFHWPESMERGDLPWEASASALELLSYLDQREVGRRERPSVRLVRWFRRVSQAAPSCPVHGRCIAAEMLTAREVDGGRVSVRGVEWWLAYRPWEGETRIKGYGEAASRAETPIPLMEASWTFSESELEDNPELHALAESLSGKSLAGSGAFIWTMMPDDVDRKIIRIEESNDQASASKQRRKYLPKEKWHLGSENHPTE